MHAFRLGIGIAGLLAILGGIVALVGIENPRRPVPAAMPHGAAGVALPAPWQTHS